MISSTTRTAGPYAGTGLQTVFGFNFKVFQASDVLVVQTDASGNVTTLALTTNYSVALNSNQDTSPGGSITLLVAPATGYSITLSSQVQALQGANLTNAGNFYPSVINNALDYLTILVQQLSTIVGNALRLPLGTSGVSTTLPTPVGSTGLGWNSTGTAIINYVLQAGTSLVSLAASTGSSLVGFIQSGTGAVARTVQDKARESVSVLDFGAVGDGATDDTVAFTHAQASATYIEVPAGMNCKVSAGLNSWKFYGAGTVTEPGRVWQLSRSPQTDQTQKVYRDTYGTFESAAGSSLAINRGTGQVQENTEVEGATTQYLAINYSGRDHVGQYTAAYSFTPQSIPDAGATYTDNTVTSTSISGFTVKPGMLIDTAHAAPYLGKVVSVSGNTITVDAWYLQGTGVAGTPVSAKGATINPNVKIWAHNANLHLVSGGQANAGTGFELGLLALKTGTGAGTVGFDAVTLTGSEPTYTHFTSRGSSQRGYRNDTGKTYGFESETSAEINFWSKQDKAGAGSREGYRSTNAKIGVRSIGDTKGVSIEDPTGNALETSVAAVTRTVINSAGKFSGLFANTGSYGASGTIAADVTFAVGLGTPINLPPVIAEDGQVVFFTNQTGSPITVNGNGNTISGSASTSIASLNGMMFVSFGGNWLITVL